MASVEGAIQLWQFTEEIIEMGKFTTGYKACDRTARLAKSDELVR